MEEYLLTFFVTSVQLQVPCCLLLQSHNLNNLCCKYHHVLNTHLPGNKSIVVAQPINSLLNKILKNQNMLWPSCTKLFKFLQINWLKWLPICPLAWLVMKDIYVEKDALFVNLCFVIAQDLSGRICLIISIETNCHSVKIVAHLYIQ